MKNALVKTKKLLRIDPDDTDTLFYLSTILGTLNNPTKAKRLFSKCSDLSNKWQRMKNERIDL